MANAIILPSLFFATKWLNTVVNWLAISQTIIAPIKCDRTKKNQIAFTLFLRLPISILSIYHFRSFHSITAVQMLKLTSVDTTRLR